MLQLQIHLLTTWLMARDRIHQSARRLREDDRGELTAGVIFLVALAVAAVGIAALVIGRINSNASKIPE